MNRRKRRVIRNVFFICASVLGAFLLVKTGGVDRFLSSVGEFANVGSFLAGMFFTSVFTTVPAMVVLGELAQTHSPYVVALFGGIGAVCGDYVLFLIVRNGLSEDVAYLIKHSPFQRFRKVFHTKLFDHFLPLLGALVLASPLPDEIGLAMLGFSKVDKDRFLLISLAMNTVGIFAIAIVARSIGS